MSDKTAEVSRRTFLKRALGHSAVIATAAVIAQNEWNRQFSKPPEILPAAPETNPEPQLGPPKQKVGLEKKTEPIDINTLNQIHSLPITLKNSLGNEIPNSNRSSIENNYVNSAKTRQQIDAGLSIVVDSRARAELQAKRMVLRDPQIEDFKPLTEEEKQWAINNQVSYESYAIAKDIYQDTLKVAALLQAKGLLSKDTPPQNLIPPPETIAMIAKYETGGWGYIGNTFSSKVFKNPDHKKHIQERSALQKLADNLKQDTGIDFNPNNFPSSDTGDIGFQFRPSTALEIYNCLSQVGVKFNPYDPESGTLGAYIYLAMKGYDSRSQTQVDKAFKAWNPVIGEKKDIKEADSHFRTKDSLY